MIDKRYQGKEYRKQAFQLTLDYIYTFKYIWFSYKPNNDITRYLYR